MTDPGFDPRHDARFQRGYQPGEARRAPGPDTVASAGVPADAPSASVAGSEAVPAAGHHAAPPRGPAVSQAALIADLEARLEAIREDTTPGAASDLIEVLPVDAEVALRRTRHLNPFIIGLWILGPLLMTGGAWLQMQAMSATRSYDAFDVAQEQFDMALRQLLWSLTPAMMTAGLTTVLGLLFWHAWHWRSRHTCIRAGA
ncbi:hypothetical protein [Cryobacterium psychrophilum]|uniref:Uncharacterized protein n=1 Tax=Cryobacterium psychrophilum TaxID=41988 RepID=A0A4Y8KMQ0_9MICO|nr:hypothetical protein [Cryobacterium psychrophilum]TDW30340.1 hypothetical protein EDD25_2089 [Cryobacterium psychrophilum]TFD79037.1 hypothetical protein E3T53_08000 [Cryobacterium psychrophilum]